METYPSIKGPSKAPKQPCIAFYKYDGSNLRFEWTKKTGWCKYGTRKQMIDHTHNQFGEAIGIFHNTLADPLEKIFRDNYRDSQKVTVFAEYFGENSFAGQHEDEEHKLVLIDTKIYKKGFISPREFLKNFCKPLGDLAAQVVYDGNMNAEFVQNVRDNKYDLFEGVVCKGGSGHKLWRCKIKTDEYRTKLINHFGHRWHEFWEGDSEEIVL